MSRATDPAAETVLAEFISTIRIDDVPGAVIDRVGMLLLDAIASALAGRRTADTPAVVDVAGALGEGRSTIIGGGRGSLAGATFLNGYLITAATVCDVHREILCHTEPVVLPPTLALAEARDSRGSDILVALAVGFETTVRVGLAMDYPRFRARGWHSPGVVGPFGGAAAGARLLGLDPVATRHALGFAGSQSAGTFAGLGSSQVKFHQARGAVSGLLAALTAEAGLDASERILTAPDGGLLTTYIEGGLPERLTAGLGKDWELMGISMRRWPAASSLQAVVEAALEIGGAGGPALRDIRKVTIALPSASYRLNGHSTWDDQLGAFQSAAYVAAVVLADGRCWLEQYAEDRITDRSIAALVRDRVVVIVDEDLAPAGAELIVEPADGPPLTARIAVPAGDPTRHLSMEHLIAKLGDATRGTSLDGRSDAIIEQVAGLAASSSIEPLLASLR